MTDDPYTLQDGFHSAGISYMAGVSEEALFRGWLLPRYYKATDSFFVANTLQSSLFAASHLNQTKVPIFQFALAYYLAWLTERNDWDLEESVFIHAWWDVIALSIQYSQKETKSFGSRLTK